MKNLKSIYCISLLLLIAGIHQTSLATCSAIFNEDKNLEKEIPINNQNETTNNLQEILGQAFLSKLEGYSPMKTVHVDSDTTYKNPVTKAWLGNWIRIY